MSFFAGMLFDDFEEFFSSWAITYPKGTNTSGSYSIFTTFRRDKTDKGSPVWLERAALFLFKILEEWDKYHFIKDKTLTAIPQVKKRMAAHIVVNTKKPLELWKPRFWDKLPDGTIITAAYRALQDPFVAAPIIEAFIYPEISELKRFSKQEYWGLFDAGDLHDLDDGNEAIRFSLATVEDMSRLGTKVRLDDAEFARTK